MYKCAIGVNDKLCNQSYCFSASSYLNVSVSFTIVFTLSILKHSSVAMPLRSVPVVLKEFLVTVQASCYYSCLHLRITLQKDRSVLLFPQFLTGEKLSDLATTHWSYSLVSLYILTGGNCLCASFLHMSLSSYLGSFFYKTVSLTVANTLKRIFLVEAHKTIRNTSISNTLWDI